ncbi:MAG TPA: hypothetical protein VMM93_07315, partial [Vicinamibacterales bacterium]|nr:hypothetical protein [Vicinamibacterales bacterium]
VNRPGVTVLYRRGYFGSRQLPAMNRLEMLTYSRITGAANYDRDVPDIGLTGTLTQDGTGVTVDLVITATRLSLIEQAGRRAGTLKIAAFAGDRNERIIGEVWQDLDLEYTAARYQEVLTDGIPHQMRVPVVGVPTYMKVVVYDHNADLVGSRTLKIR